MNNYNIFEPSYKLILYLASVQTTTKVTMSVKKRTLLHFDSITVCRNFIPTTVSSLSVVAIARSFALRYVP